MKPQISWILSLVVLVTGTSCSGKQPAPETTKSEVISEAKNDSTVVEKPLNDSLKYIYLTFDDGPLNGSEYIDSLAWAEKIKINVFAVSYNMKLSNRMRSYFQMYNQNPYVEIYNHSYTHANNKYKRFYSDPQNVLNDIIRNQDTLGLKYKIVRLPGRNIWRVGDRKRDYFDSSGEASANLIAANGYQIFGWDMEWRHNSKTGKPIQSVSSMLNEVNSRLQKGTTFTPGNIVVLLHDEMFREKTERDELKSFLDSLKMNKNYVFEHVRSYPLK
ncbi:MAG: polysaccharide deacetylase family protein [Bacteroidetes bacterium]|nr:polysaccharide deacetylase family protein [Bacteroidota bacterium]